MRTLLTTALLTSFLSGCAATGLSGDDNGDSREIAAAFYPLAYVAEQIGGGDFDVQLLTTPGAEPHDLELNVQETATIAQADLVIYQHGFQPAVDTAVDEVAEGRTLDVAEVTDLQPADEHAAGEEEAGHEHEDGLDPHFWHDPLRMADLGDVVADDLGELDPAHEEEYRTRAQDFRDRMEALDQEYAAGLRDCERDLVVVSHDAFGYLEKYGLHFAPIAGLSPDAEPTPAHLAELQKLAKESGVTTVFAETLGSKKMADSLASDLGLRTEVLDPIEGVAAGSDDDYETLMRRNLANLQEANGC